MKLLPVLLALAACNCAAVMHRDTGGVPAPRPAPQLSVEVQSVCHVSDPWAGVVVQEIPLHGSGVPVDHHRVLTAEHVVADPFVLELMNEIAKCPTVPDVHVVFPDGRQIRAYVDREDVEHDVASLRTVEDTGFGPVETAAPEVGDTVCSSASVPRIEHACGVISDVGGEDGADFHVVAEGHPGNSGGGVWDSRGRLIGLLTQGPRPKRIVEFGATSAVK